MRYADFRDITEPDIFLSYLKAVSRNAALDALRRLALRTRQFELDLSLAPGDPSDVLPTPEEIYLARELRDELLGHLDNESQYLLDMLVDGYALGEISEKLGISYSAAGVRVHRLRDRVRKYMKERQIRPGQDV
jgi:DNA-directed RNA polymerase specialized sigma24 family protein